MAAVQRHLQKVEDEKKALQQKVKDLEQRKEDPKEVKEPKQVHADAVTLERLEKALQLEARLVKLEKQVEKKAK